MCFNLIASSQEVYYRSIKIYAKKIENTYYYFWKNISEFGTFERYEKAMDQFFNFMDNETQEYIKTFKYGICLLRKNADLLDEESNIILRGSKEELKTYMDIKKLTFFDTDAWDELFTKWSEKMVARGKFADTSIEVGGKSFQIKPITGGSNFKGVSGLEGLGPDFSYTPELLYNGNLSTSSKVIKLTGSRDLDFQIANKMAGLESTPKGFTWHHLDDFDPASGTATMQLVRTEVHKAFSHGGGASMWKAFYGIEYK